MYDTEDNHALLQNDPTEESPVTVQPEMKWHFLSAILILIQPKKMQSQIA